MGANKFNYTRLGGETEIEGVDDRADMAETRRTFSLLGNRLRFTKTFNIWFSLAYLSRSCLSICELHLLFLRLSCFSLGLKDSFQADVFKVLAAILHLGNVVIKENSSEKSSIGVRIFFFICAVLDNLDVFSIDNSQSCHNTFCFLSSPETLTWPYSVTWWAWTWRTCAAGYVTDG